MYVCIAPWILIQEEILRNPTLILIRGSPTAPKTSMVWPLHDYPFFSSPHLTNNDLPSELSVSAVVQVPRLCFSDCLCIDQIILPGGKKSGQLHHQLWGCFGICSSSVHLLTPYLPEQKTGGAPSLQRSRTPSRALRFGCNELSVCGPLKFRSLYHSPWRAGIGDGPLGGSLDYMRYWR